MIDDKARAIIEAALRAAFLKDDADIVEALVPIDQGARAANVAICAVAQAEPPTSSDRMADFHHEPWCDVSHYAATLAGKYGKCPTCLGSLKGDGR